MVFLGSGDLNTALPATKIFAPARTKSDAFSAVTPPSISIWVVAPFFQLVR